MPIYEYLCQDGHTTEKIIQGNPFRMEISRTMPCETCGMKAIRKMVNTVSVSVDNEWVCEHFGPKPVLVKSRKHMKELLKQHGLRQTHDPFR